MLARSMHALYMHSVSTLEHGARSDGSSSSSLAYDDDKDEPPDEALLKKLCVSQNVPKTPKTTKILPPPPPPPPQIVWPGLSGTVYSIPFIRESVDSLCSDGADAQYMKYLNTKAV